MFTTTDMEVFFVKFVLTNATNLDKICTIIMEIYSVDVLSNLIMDGI